MSGSLPDPSSRDHPRIRGEHPPMRRRKYLLPGSSPHPRGTPNWGTNVVKGKGIIPASAGNTCSFHFFVLLVRDHPRIRGEHGLQRSGSFLRVGSSPHPRGTLTEFHSACRSPRIIPASAGNTPAALRSSSSRRDHPRIRGEHRLSDLSQTDTRGSSPHPRGTHFVCGKAGNMKRIIPASAGNT